MTSVEDYLKQNVFGAPQLKPDERKKFLGNFQERVALALTVAQTRNPDNLKIVDKIMQQNPQYHLYLNGRLSSIYRQPFIKLAVKNNFQFTIIEQANMRASTKKVDEQDMGLIIADDNQAIHKPTLL